LISCLTLDSTLISANNNAFARRNDVMTTVARV
jgi:hypothetical protein